MLLYSARKRDQASSTSDDLNQPLLPEARPPAEAFLAFLHHRQGVDMDDSFFCGSPPPHVFAPSDDIEVADEETLSTDSEPGSPLGTQPH
jgi:hypothetical protein